MLFNIVTKGPLWVVEQSRSTLKRGLGYANDLKQQELALHKSLETADVGAVLKGKRLVLLEKLAHDLGWPDTEIFGFIRGGFSLVGNAAPSGVFDIECKPAQLTVEELLQTRRYMRPALLGKTASAKLNDDCVELWEKTCKESDGRLLRGLFTVAEVDELFPKVELQLGGLGFVRAPLNLRSCGPSMITVSAKLIKLVGTRTRLISGLWTS